MFICSSGFHACFYGKKTTNYKLSLYEFNSMENDEFKIIRKNSQEGNFCKIINTSLISDNFLITLIGFTNFLIKINMF